MIKDSCNDAVPIPQTQRDAMMRDVIRDLLKGNTSPCSIIYTGDCFVLAFRSGKCIEVYDMVPRSTWDMPVEEAESL